MLVALIIARTAHIGATILLMGTFTFKLITLGPRGRAGSDDFDELQRRLLRLAQWSLIAALLSALLWFWLEVVSMSGLPPMRALSTTAWQMVLFETKFGRVWQLRLGLIAVAFALVELGLVQVRARHEVVMIVSLISIVLLVSLAWISHAAAARVQPLGLLGDAVHLCAAGGWIGGLAPLVIFLRRPVSFSLGERFALALERFSTLSFCCVSVLIVTGISNSWLLVGSLRALFTTRYGLLLLCKLILFGILVGIGARNRLAIKSELRAQSGSDLLPQLRRNVISEMCFGAAVVAIVGCLGATPPLGHP